MLGDQQSTFNLNLTTKLKFVLAAPGLVQGLLSFLIFFIHGLWSVGPCNEALKRDA